MSIFHLIPSYYFLLDLPHSYLGDEPHRRAYVDTAVHNLMVPNIHDSSQVNGVIKGFQIHTQNTKDVQISVWRHETGDDYRSVRLSKKLF